jgi:hypothetical protein
MPRRMHRATWNLLRVGKIFGRCISASFRSRNEQGIFERALRQELAPFAQVGRRPRITPVDRGFRVFLSRGWAAGEESLGIVEPDNDVRWHLIRIPAPTRDRSRSADAEDLRFQPRCRSHWLDDVEWAASIVAPNGEMQHDLPGRHRGTTAVAPADE